MTKRKKYKPRRVISNPIAHIIESRTPVKDYDEYLINLKIKNSAAMVALMRGDATKMDMNTLIAMSNVTEALHQLGVGEEHHDICLGGWLSIIKISERAVSHERFTPTGQEVQLLNRLMELHDAQMDVVTVRDIEKAMSVVHHNIKHAKNTVRLPTMKEALK